MLTEKMRFAMMPTLSSQTAPKVVIMTICEATSDDKIGIHYSDIIMGTMASQITSLTIVYSTVYSGADQRKHQSSALLAFVRGIQRIFSCNKFTYVSLI